MEYRFGSQVVHTFHNADWYSSRQAGDPVYRVKVAVGFSSGEEIPASVPMWMVGRMQDSMYFLWDELDDIYERVRYGRLPPRKVS